MLADNAAFSRDFEEYRRACRARFEQQKSSYGGSDDAVEPEPVDEAACEMQTNSPTISPQTTTSVAECNNTINNSPAINSVLDTPVGKVKASNERRNSLGKVFSSLSNMFKSSPPMSPHEKEKAKQERKKREQDARMAHLIAQLEFEGRSDAEIQMHLFHLRDIAQHTAPRNNNGSLLGEWFRDMHQAFKDEFSLRRERQCVTVHVSTVNPFAAAMPANYVHDGNYSYEDLLTLESVPRGLTSTAHLPTSLYEGQELPSNQTSCAVCMADFEISEELRSLACTHHFHKECIDKWLGVAPSCPVCKGEVSRE